MKRKIEFSPVNLRGIADIYSIRIDGEPNNEFRKFLILFKSETDRYLQDDFFRIAEAIKKISEIGALERFFRPEGKFADRVFAIPRDILHRDKSRHGTLRLYCLRISDKLLIIGGGGKKTTDAYNEDPALLEAVETLQSVDSELLQLEEDGNNIEEDIQNITILLTDPIIAMKQYIDPLFQEVLDSVPQHIKGEVDRSFDLSSRIDSLLREKGWTKTDLARKTGKKNSEVSKWLSGTQNFTLRTIALIEEALDAELIQVVGTDSDQTDINVHYFISMVAGRQDNQTWKQRRSTSKQGAFVNVMNQWI